MYKLLPSLILLLWCTQQSAAALEIAQNDTELSGNNQDSLTRFINVPVQQVNETRAFRRNEMCGARFSRWHDKIVGGTKINIGQAPWQCSLQASRYPYNSNTHFCGASIISSNFILTAAHCAKGFSTSSLRVVCGVTDLAEIGDHAVIRKIRKSIIHPDYSEKTIENDIALMEMDTPIDLTGRNSPVSAVCLPGGHSAPSGSCGVTGYGRLSESGSSSTHLRQVMVPIIPNSTCEKSYPGKIFSSMICAGYPEGQKDACQGDSGGPLVKIENGRAVQYGITSWGIGCARQGKPGVYTNVAALVDFIVKAAVSNE